MTAMTIERFTELACAYGARPERWPDDERSAALALLEGSPDARARLAEASRLDALLDDVPAVPPSADLAARVLAGAPRRATVHRLPQARPAPKRWLAPAALGMAAAAGLAIWLVRMPPVPTPLADDAMAQLGVFDVPTDDFLSALDLDLGDDTPPFGCDDPTVGCADADAEPARRSDRSADSKEISA
jgi:hypothetical protein